MHLFEFDAIGTHWWIEPLDIPSLPLRIQNAIIYTAEQFNRDYSRFREDSLITKLSQEGIIRNPPQEMLHMLDFAQEMAIASEGVFCLSVGNTLHSLGYGKRRHGRKALRDEWQHIRYDTTAVTVPKGTILDFGGFGKGWLIDTFARILTMHGCKEFIINGGGDLYVASHKPIEFALEDPYNPRQKIGQTTITTGALAVSNTVKRAWQHKGSLHHHIIDPRTDASAQTGTVAAYVRASTALIADTLATICILRPDIATELCRYYDAKVLLVPSATEPTTTQMLHGESD